MERLGLGILVLIYAIILGCTQAGPTSSSSQSQPMQQLDQTGSDRGGTH